MVLKADQLRMKALLKETITLLCKNGLNYKSEFSVEALIGITLDKGDVFLVNINERITDGLGGQVESSEADTCADVASPISAGGMDTTGDERSHSSSRRRRRRSRQGSPSASDTQYTNTPIEDTSNDRSFKMEDSDQFSSCQYENETSTTDRSNKRTNPGDQEDDSRVDFSSKRARSDDGSNGSDDVVFVKDEPFSDSELEQVSLGIAQHAQSQAMQELSYMPGSSQLGVPSGRTEPLPGCSNWTGQNPDVSVSSEMGSQLADPSSANSSIQVQGRHAGLTGGMMVGDVPPGIVNMPRCPLCAMVFSSQLEAIQHQKFCNKESQMTNDDEIDFADQDGSCHTISDKSNVSPELETNTEHDVDELAMTQCPSVDNVQKENSPAGDEHFTCSICDYSSTKKSYMSRHMRVKHNSSRDSRQECKDNMFICSQCAKSFKTKVGLTEHEKLKHSNNARYKCTVCSKQFMIKSTFINHQNSHYKIKVHKCTVCHRSFSLRTALQEHNKSCVSGKQHQCTVCGKLFTRPASLHDHIRAVHEKKTAYRCSCGKFYSWKRALIRHQAKGCKIEDLNLA